MNESEKPAPPQNRPSPIATNGYTHSNRVAPLTVEERAVQDALALIEEHGYGIAMRCLDCQHPITTPTSLSRGRGAHCHAKAVANGNR
jgi:hypothetical protein